MPQPFSTPRFNAVTLTAAYEVIDERDAARPLLNLFPRVQFNGTEVVIRRFRDKPQRVRHTAAGARAMPVPRETMEELRYKPTYIKLKDQIEGEELNNFVDYETYAEMGEVGPRQNNRLAQIDRANQRVARRFQLHATEERHVLACGALRGGYSYKLGDQTITVDQKLTELDAPTIPWDDDDATIFEDIASFQREFRNNNGRGLDATHIFYSPDGMRSYFLKNKQWLAAMAANPALAAWFTGIRNGSTAGVDFMDLNGRIQDPLFGLTWVPIEGSFKDYDNSIVKRWPDNKLSLVRLGPDGAVPQWLMAFDALQNPEPTWRIEVRYPQEGEDVKAIQAVFFDNGIPAFEFPEMVTTVTVVPD